MTTEGDYGWCDREAAARHRLVRKEIGVNIVCWLIVAPAIPIAIVESVVEWIADKYDTPRWCIWLAEKADAFAERNGVRWCP